MLKRFFTWVTVLSITALILGACSSGEDSASESKGEAVATVNGEEISRTSYEKELETTKATYAQQGVNLDDLDKETVKEMERALLDQLINTKLVLQSSEKEGITVEENEIDAELEKVTSQFPDEKKYEDALKEMNLTEKSLKQRIKEQLTITEYLESKSGEITVSDEDVQALYNQYKEQVKSQDQEPEPLETIKPQLEEQATVQKRNEKFNEVVDQLRKTNEENIKILL